MADVLLVDGCRVRRARLSAALSSAGYRVAETGTLREALAVLGPSVEAVILALPLPDAEAGDALRLLRVEGAVPVLLLGERCRETESLAASCLPSATSPGEVVRHLENLLALHGGHGGDGGHEETLRLRRMEVHVKARKVYVEGREIVLAPREFELLLFFLRHPHEVLSRERILEALWPEGAVSAHVVDVHLAELRRKLGRDTIQTLRGYGYRLELPVQHRPTIS